METITQTRKDTPNGPALAAFLAAAIGSFALGLIVLADAGGILSLPAVYAPAGGVTGRTTLAVVLWLATWGFLHFRWRHQQRDQRRIRLAGLVLIGLGIVMTLPPVWSLFG